MSAPGGPHRPYAPWERPAAPYPAPSSSGEAPASPDGPVTSGETASGHVPMDPADEAAPSDAPAAMRADMSRSSAPAPSAPDGPTPGRSILGALYWVAAAIGSTLAMQVAPMLVASAVATVLAICVAIEGADRITTQVVLIVSISMQLAWLAMAWPWWRHVRPRPHAGAGAGDAAASAPGSPDGRAAAGSFPVPGASDAPTSGTAGRIAGIVLLGVGLQMTISLLLGLILPLFPEVSAAYDSMMEDAGVSEFSLLAALTVAVLAPLVEELTYRGVVLQYLVRAVAGTPVRRARRVGAPAPASLPRARFWAANAAQALMFGVAHLNITQGIYAFGIGLVFGWMVRRTGRLRDNMALHLVVNFSSFFVNELAGVLGIFGGASLWTGSLALALAGGYLFCRATQSGRACGRDDAEAGGAAS